MSATPSKRAAVLLSKAELFRALRYRAHPGQLRVHRSRALRRILACGARWGKTTCAIYELVAALLEPREEAIGWIVAPTYELSSRIFHRVVAILQQKFSHHIVELSVVQRMITVRNFGGGISMMVAKSADNPDSLLGEGLSFLVIDEAARLDGRIWDEFLSQRLIDRGGWLLALSTPHGCNWFYRLYKRGQKARDADYESWCSPSWENPALNRAVIEAERTRLSSAVFDENYSAKFVGEDLEPCDVCHGPRNSWPPVVCKPRNGDLMTCRECGLYVDEHGETVMGRESDGRPVVHLLSFVPRSNGEECFATRCVNGVEVRVGDPMPKGRESDGDYRPEGAMNIALN